MMEVSSEFNVILEDFLARQKQRAAALA